MAKSEIYPREGFGGSTFSRMCVIIPRLFGSLFGLRFLWESLGKEVLIFWVLNFRVFLIECLVVKM